eukprot:jgi/Chrzof1/13505/Cz08g00100.t1
MVDSWHNTAGWLTAQQSGSCAQYLASQPQALPAYCNWFGVGCAQDTQNTSCPVSSQAYRISSIDLSVNNASGSINSSDFLQPLQLLHDCGMTSFKIGGGAYYLTGTLSPQLGRLTNLAQLSFFAANITGTLPPEMGNLARLQQLDLSSNYITGTIPESFGNLTSLTSLNLAFNGWTDIGKALDGPIPATFTRLSKMIELNLEANGLQGTVPGSLCSSMTALEQLSLRANSFTGPATQLSSCKSLIVLDLEVTKDTHSNGKRCPALGHHMF